MPKEKRLVKISKRMDVLKREWFSDNFILWISPLKQQMEK
jgi:hypothetical protein